MHLGIEIEIDVTRALVLSQAHIGLVFIKLVMHAVQVLVELLKLAQYD